MEKGKEMERKVTY